MTTWTPVWAVIVVLLSHAQSGRAQECDPVEAQWRSAPAYKQAVCDGYAALSEGDYPTAVEAFEAALANEERVDWPSFEALPRLAQAQWMAGRLDSARVTLERAELTLAVYAGIFSCREYADGHWQIIAYGGRPAEREYRETDYAARRMCGAVFADHWGARTFGSLQNEAALVRIYFEVEDLIKKGDSEPWHERKAVH